MNKISALMTVYNESTFTDACLRSIEPLIDQFVIVEGSWKGLRGTYDYKENLRSSDGTREIVEKFVKDFPHKATLYNSLEDEECCRNLGLGACDNRWILHLDSDEFYYLDQLSKLKERLHEYPNNSILMFKEYSFYFNFNYYTVGKKKRLFDGWNLQYYSNNGVGDVLKNMSGEPNVELDVPASILHFQWVGNRKKVLDSPNYERQLHNMKQFKLDPKEHYIGCWDWWVKEVYTQFNGKNLKELEAKCNGSIHPWSYHHKEHRPRLLEIDDEFVFPGYLYRYPWFDIQEEGLIDFSRYAKKE